MLLFLIPTLMTAENELLTPTMKVVRCKVNEEFDSTIDSMYAGTA